MSTYCLNFSCRCRICPFSSSEQDVAYGQIANSGFVQVLSLRDPMAYRQQQLKLNGWSYHSGDSSFVSPSITSSNKQLDVLYEE